MIFQVIILVLSFLLDGILSNFFSYMLGSLSLFTPYFTVVSLIIIYPYFIKNKKKYFLVAGILGFLYDLFYTNLLFANLIFFLILALTINYIFQKIELNFLTNFLVIIFIIVFYHVIYALSLFVFNVVPISFEKVGYLILHSIFSNIIYGEILYLICKYLPYKRHLN